MSKEICIFVKLISVSIIHGALHLHYCRKDFVKFVLDMYNFIALLLQNDELAR